MRRIILEGSVFYVEYDHYNRFRKSYYSMKTRTNPDVKTQRVRKHYVDRGIETCELWSNSFKQFFLDMYESYCDHVTIYGVKETTLDRIDNDKGYSKSNCRWATLKQQMNNTSRQAHYRKRNMQTTRELVYKLMTTKEE